MLPKCQRLAAITAVCQMPNCAAYDQTLQLYTHLGWKQPILLNPQYK